MYCWSYIPSLVIFKFKVLLFCSSGDIYEGSYKNGKKHGKGKYKSYDDGKLQDVYDGNYSGGQRHGFGKMNFANGDVYSGQYVNNKMSGKGKMIYSNKDGM